MDGGGGDRMDVDVDDKSAGGGTTRRDEGDGPHKDPSSVSPPSPRRRGRGMPKLQLFDLVAGGAFERALEGMGRQEGGEEGVWSYLPLFLQMLRDGSTKSGAEVGDRFDKLLRVVVQNRRADSTEDYLNIARDCCTHLRKGPVAPPTTAFSRMASRLATSSPQPQHSAQSSKTTDSRSASPVPAGGGGEGGEGARQGPAMTEWDVVVAAIDQEKEKANAEAAGGGGGGGGGSDAGGSVSRRDGKQMDLLLEVESLEPKQLMSSGGRQSPSRGVVSRASSPALGVGATVGRGGAAAASGAVEGRGGDGGGGAAVGRSGDGGGGSSESLDLLSQRSLEEELHMLLPVLLAHAPRVRMREASAALLRTRFAPSLLHVSAMNDPLSLESIVLGVCDAVTATPGITATRTSHNVSRRAEELVMRLCGLGAIASVKVRGVLLKRRSLPGICAKVACEVLCDADSFVLSVAAATASGEDDEHTAAAAAAAAVAAAAAAGSSLSKRSGHGRHHRQEDDGGVALGGGGNAGLNSHWFWGHLRKSPAVTEQLLNTVLAKVEALARETVRGGGGAAATAYGDRIAGSTAAPATTAPVGELCAALRAYCELVGLGRPAALTERHLQAAMSAPTDALEAVLLLPSAAPGPAAAATTATVARRGATTSVGGEQDDEAGMSAAVAKLEEIIVGSILLTAGGVAAAATAAVAGGSGAMGGVGSSGGGDKKVDDDGGGSRTAAEGVGAEKGARRCASALRRLLLLCRLTSTGGGGSRKSGNGVRRRCCCCAGLYAALLLRGARFEAVANVVSEVLGSTPPPLTGPGGVDALDALRDAALAASESEFPRPPPSPRPSNNTAADAAAAAAAAASPPMSPRGGPKLASARRGSEVMPPLSLAGGGGSGNASGAPLPTPRVRPRSWSAGSGGGGGRGSGTGKEAAAAAASAAAAVAAAAGGAGWFSEAALADCVKALPPSCSVVAVAAPGSALAPPVSEGVEGEPPAVATAAWGGASVAAAGAGRWRLCPVDCVEEALEQGLLVRCRVDLRDWVLSTILGAGNGTTTSISSSRSSRGGAPGGKVDLHPSLLRVVCLYAKACVAPDLGAGDGAGKAFVMTALLPTEIAEIVQAVDWVGLTVAMPPSKDPLFPGMPPPLPHPSMTPSAGLLQPGGVVVGAPRAAGGGGVRKPGNWTGDVPSGGEVTRRQ
ncbi:unnamed protein product [Ectocarpus sp. 4 AP-2014]